MGKTPAKALTPAQKAARKAAKTRAAKKAEADRLERAQAQRLAQIVNLHIAGFSLADIGQSIGATPEEVDRLLSSETARYVRSQPALRTYVRNWISERYTKMIEANWDHAVDKNSPQRLENQDRVVRMLDSMRRMHGADLPVQSEVKIEAAPEAVEQLVTALAAQQGLDYDTDIFDVDGVDAVDVVDAEIVEEHVHRAVEAAERETVVSGNAADQPQEGEDHDL